MNMKPNIKYNIYILNLFLSPIPKYDKRGNAVFLIAAIYIFDNCHLNICNILPYIFHFRLNVIKYCPDSTLVLYSCEYLR